MASVSSVGIGSGVLTSELIDKLANAEREPVEKRLKLREDSVKAKLSDFGRLQSAVTELRLTARTLGNPSSLAAKTASSSSSGIAVTASTSAAAAQYSMEVTGLAQSHSIATAVFADQDQTALGTGKITIKSGSSSKTITLDNSNNTLQGLAKEINGAKVGVSASVINTGAGYQMVLTSEKTGTANAIELTVDDDDGVDTDVSGLSALAFNAGANNLTEKVAAADALFSVNGISITRSSNTITDVIDGLTFSLTDKTTTPATIKVARDADGVSTRVQELVDKFNELQKIYNEVTQYVPGGESGSLAGNSTVRTIQAQVRSIVASVVPGLEGAGVRSLSEVGISTNSKTGELSFDQTKFKEKLASNETDVVALFADQGRTTDSQIEFVRAGLNTKVGTYGIEVTQMATQANFTAASALSGNTVIDANNNTFSIKVNGTESDPIVLTDNAVGYTDADLVTELQTKINADAKLKAAGVALTVSLDGANQLVFTSSKYGSASKVEFTSVGTNSLATLGIDAIAGTDGLDITGKINGLDATGVGQTLSAATGDAAEGVQVKVTGGVTGARGTVTYLEGVGDQFVKLINNYLGAEGTITNASDGFNKQLENISLERGKLNDRIAALTSRLAKQFTAADIIISQLKSTENFVKGQLEALAGGGDK